MKEDSQLSDVAGKKQTEEKRIRNKNTELLIIYLNTYS
jgi:hypothetical protein